MILDQEVVLPTQSDQVIGLLVVEDSLYILANSTQGGTNHVYEYDLVTSTQSTSFSPLAEFGDATRLSKAIQFDDRVYVCTENTLYSQSSGTWSSLNTFTDKIIALHSTSTYLWVGLANGQVYRVDTLNMLVLSTSLGTSISDITTFKEKLYLASGKQVYESASIDSWLLVDTISSRDDIRKLAHTDTLLYIGTGGVAVEWWVSTGSTFSLVSVDTEHRFITGHYQQQNSSYLVGSDLGVIWAINSGTPPESLLSFSGTSLLAVAVGQIQGQARVFVGGNKSNIVYSILEESLYQDIEVTSTWEVSAQVSVHQDNIPVTATSGGIENLYSDTLDGVKYVIATAIPNGLIWQARGVDWRKLNTSRQAQVTDFAQAQNRWWFSLIDGQVTVYDTTNSYFTYVNFNEQYGRTTIARELAYTNNLLHVLVTTPDSSLTEIHSIDTLSQTSPSSNPAGYSTTIRNTFLSTQGTQLASNSTHLYAGFEDGAIIQISLLDYSTISIPINLGGRHSIVHLKWLCGSLFAVAMLRNGCDYINQIFRLGALGWVLVHDFNTRKILAIEEYFGVVYFSTHRGELLKLEGDSIVLEHTFDDNVLSIITHNNMLLVGLDDELGTIRRRV